MQSAIARGAKLQPLPANIWEEYYHHASLLVGESWFPAPIERISPEGKMKNKPLLIVGGIVVILIVVILALPLFVNVNKFKPTLETDISTALGRQVTIGNINLAILSGGVTIDDVAIADDPAFSRSSFLTAKQVTAGVALIPLIFSQKLEVSSFTVTDPVVTLLRSSPGAWNFSSFGANGTKGKQGASGETNFDVAKLKISNGTVIVGESGKTEKAQKYEGVNLEASDLSFTSQFPFTFTVKIPGNGDVKIDGKAGPMDGTDAALTPLDAKIDANNVEYCSHRIRGPILRYCRHGRFHRRSRVRTANR